MAYTYSYSALASSKQHERKRASLPREEKGKGGQVPFSLALQAIKYAKFALFVAFVIIL